MTRRGQGPAWRARRRDEAVSHWPPRPSPVVSELLGGQITPRQLTRKQRLEIADLIERSADLDVWVRAEARAIAEERERPQRRLARLMRQSMNNNNSSRDAGETKE
jgi:hypothetical protein